MDEIKKGALAKLKLLDQYTHAKVSCIARSDREDAVLFMMLMSRNISTLRQVVKLFKKHFNGWNQNILRLSESLHSVD
jgi:hypothetical protein